MTLQMNAPITGLMYNFSVPIFWLMHTYGMKQVQSVCAHTLSCVYVLPLMEQVSAEPCISRMHTQKKNHHIHVPIQIHK